MNRAEQFAVLNNFEKHLIAIKAKTLKWRTVCYSQTEHNRPAVISCYGALNKNTCGDIVLIPGLAANTDIDPLMKTLLFWGLTHRRNVFCIDTFLGHFQNKATKEDAAHNTYPEFIAVLENSIKYLEKQIIPNKNIFIGHSAGATGLIDAMNKLTIKHEKHYIGSVVLFAPWASVNCFDMLIKVLRKRCTSNNFDCSQDILPVSNGFDFKETGKVRYVSVSPSFLNDMIYSDFRPDLMTKWGANITVVAGEKDTKVSVDTLKQYYKNLVEQNTHSDTLEFIVLPNARHSILQPFSNNRSVINIIKNQKTN